MNYYIRRIIQKLKRMSGSDIARELGVKVGSECHLLCNCVQAFGSEPYLISLGNHVEITSGVRFITHDGGVWTLRKKEGLENIDVLGRIIIGDNVFIGMNSIILPNVIIGNNVVIGAGSIVTKSIPDNVVCAGNPARIIKTIAEYEANVLNKGEYTKYMTPEEKQEYLLSKYEIKSVK